MKRIIALLCAVILIGTICCGCSLLPIPKRIPRPTEVPAESVAATQAQTDAATSAGETQAPATQAPAAVGKLSDYVKTGQEAAVVMSGGDEKHLRIPEILLDSTDAAAANKAIDAQFGEYIDDPEAHNYVISLDYEAYLNDNILSVYVKGSFDGGNSYGQCYSFDVNTGKELNNEALCSAAGRDYNAAIGALSSNLTEYYDDKYSNLPANDDMRNQTLASDNIAASKMLLNGSGKLSAMVDIYAAVGGGHWVDVIPAE